MKNLLNKLSNSLENIIIVFEATKDNPKKSGVLLITLIFAIYLGYKALSRIPDAIGCYWTAEVSQGVQSDKWRFNWMDNSCQYESHARWIPIKRVMDVGASDDIDDVEF